MNDHSDLRQMFDVSRETIERLKEFERLVLKWTPKINLISKNSLNDIWRRHFLDSIQVFRCFDGGDCWVDIGSGGGFPGLVCAVIAKEEWPATRFTLIESDQRKCAFLRTVSRELSLNCAVISKRIESVEHQNANVISARALADLSTLLGFCDRHLMPDGIALLPKGETWKNEVDDARKAWKFRVEPIKSKTEPQAVILKIQGLERV